LLLKIVIFGFSIPNTLAKLQKKINIANIFVKKNAFLSKKTHFLAFWRTFCIVI
jgi:hypothetical protein